MIKIFVDFNARDEDGRLWLNFERSRRDLEEHKDVIQEGLEVLFVDPDELEAPGILTFDEIHGTWKGIPDMSRLKQLREWGGNDPDLG